MRKEREGVAGRKERIQGEGNGKEGRGEAKLRQKIKGRRRLWQRRQGKQE